MKKKITAKRNQVTRHPSSHALFIHACEKWTRAMEQHRKASEAMWFGMLRLHFQDSELAMLREAGFLCPRDESLLKVADTNTTF